MSSSALPRRSGRAISRTCYAVGVKPRPDELPIPAVQGMPHQPTWRPNRHPRREHGACNTSCRHQRDGHGTTARARFAKWGGRLMSDRESLLRPAPVPDGYGISRCWTEGSPDTASQWCCQRRPRRCGRPQQSPTSAVGHDIRTDLADFDRRFGLSAAHIQVIKPCGTSGRRGGQRGRGGKTPS